MAHRAVPPHPGSVLRGSVLPGLGLSVIHTARVLRISRQTLHTILAGKAAITPEVAVRLARLSDTTAEFWLFLQQAHDLWHAEQAMAEILSQIPTYPLPEVIRTEIGCHGRTY